MTDDYDSNFNNIIPITFIRISMKSKINFYDFICYIPKKYFTNSYKKIHKWKKYLIKIIALKDMV